MTRIRKCSTSMRPMWTSTLGSGRVGCVAGSNQRSRLRDRIRSTTSRGALHAHTGRLVWVEHHPKTSVLFLKLLEQLRQQYRRAKRIVLVLDNYGIHKSRVTERWLAENPKFQLLFQPTYYPWVNVIERLWKAMHDTVTRNHRCRSMYELCQSVARFLEVVQPFPGNGHGVAHLRSAI